MRLGIKGKQVLGVTSLVGAVVVILSLLDLSRLASVSLDESRARAELVTHAIYQRARDLVVPGEDPYAALRGDPGLRSVLQSSLYSKNVTFAVITDRDGRVVAQADPDPSPEGKALPPGDPLVKLLAKPKLSQLAAIYTGQGKNFEYTEPLMLANAPIGSIRIGVSTLLIRQDLAASLGPAAVTAGAALAVAVIVAMLLAQLLLRPIHVIRSGLTRLGRGEFGVRLDLDPGDEFGDLGTSFNAISEQLFADRAGQAAIEPAGQVQAALRYARKLAALGRLSVGVAHEVKNPLNAMMIHLELLRQRFAARTQLVAAGGASAVEVAPLDPAQDPDHEGALQHIDVIANEIRRLDQVVQGFLKFSRPEDLTLQPVNLTALLDEVIQVVRPEADRTGVRLVVECEGVPDANGDAAMLRQAFLNIALNACQAMPNGGTLHIRGEPARDRRVAVSFADTGVGIVPESLHRIFDLYFTTKAKGSGIGLSMVYRTVQMHDGEIEVQSIPGTGTTFRILLPQA
jgi:signal transduction histidine kinase